MISSAVPTKELLRHLPSRDHDRCRRVAENVDRNKRRGQETMHADSVFGSNMPMALPLCSANHSRFWASTRPRRGGELALGVLYTVILPVLASTLAIRSPAKSRRLEVVLVIRRYAVGTDRAVGRRIDGLIATRQGAFTWPILVALDKIPQFF
jgi:hypothetical protein